MRVGGEKIKASSRNLYPKGHEFATQVFFKTFTNQVQVPLLRSVPVVPHKAVAEVSRIGHYRRD